jgi:peptidyl-prolyl cis-trans isomerase C
MSNAFRKVMNGIVPAALVFAVAGNAHAVDLAKVNGRALTDRDLQLALSNLNEGQRENLLKDANVRREILVRVIDQEVLVQEAEKAKMDQDAEFKEAMGAFKRQYLANRLLQKNLSSKMSESAAKKYYEGNRTRYSTDQVQALHVQGVRGKELGRPFG